MAPQTGSPPVDGFRPSVFHFTDGLRVEVALENDWPRQMQITVTQPWLTDPNGAQLPITVSVASTLAIDDRVLLHIDVAVGHGVAAGKPAAPASSCPAAGP